MTRSVNPQVPGSSPGRGARIQKSPAFTGWAFCFPRQFGIGCVERISSQWFKPCLKKYSGTHVVRLAAIRSSSSQKLAISPLTAFLQREILALLSRNNQWLDKRPLPMRELATTHVSTHSKIAATIQLNLIRTAIASSSPGRRARTALPCEHQISSDLRQSADANVLAISSRQQSLRRDS